MPRRSPQKEIYSSIYNKLHRVIPDLEKHLAKGASSGKSELPSPGMMDLSFDYLYNDEDGNPVIAIAHYFKQNGDVVPDPDMEIRIFPKEKLAEALTFQDQFVFQRVYDEYKGEPFVHFKRKTELNAFLNQWLSNLIEQGHRIDLSEHTQPVTPPHISVKGEQGHYSLKKPNNMSNTEEQNQPINESKMYFIEKAAWKKGEEMMTVVVGEKDESKNVVGYVRLEGYDANRKPILISTDVDGKELFPASNNLFELKKQFKDNERRLIPASQEKESTPEVSEEIQESEESDFEEMPENPEQKKESEVKDLRQKKDKDKGINR